MKIKPILVRRRRRRRKGNKKIREKKTVKPFIELQGSSFVLGGTE